MSPVDAPKATAVFTAVRLDALLGKYTMYRLILLVLAALAAYSLLLNALGAPPSGHPQPLPPPAVPRALGPGPTRQGHLPGRGA